MEATRTRRGSIFLEVRKSDNLLIERRKLGNCGLSRKGQQGGRDTPTTPILADFSRGTSDAMQRAWTLFWSWGALFARAHCSVLHRGSLRACARR